MTSQENIDILNFTSKFTEHDRIMILNIFVDSSNNDLLHKYKIAAQNHNSKLYNEPIYYDSGFDLFLVCSSHFQENSVTKIDFNICCSAKMIKPQTSLGYQSGYYIYPRSSISKTPLRLANNTGIIDAGYRGHIIGMFDVLQTISYDAYCRFIQICAPNLAPIYVNIVETFEDLGPQTSRNDGGFGSTGI
jgi:dUTP pyrophosphatase